MISATIVGNLGKDAELRHTGDNTKVCGFRVACQTSFKKEDPPTWVNVSVWGERAAKIVQFLTKGTKVVVRGSLTQRAWSSNGKSGVDLELRADDVELAGGGERRDGQSQSQQQPAQQNTSQQGGYPASWDQNEMTRGL